MRSCAGTCASWSCGRGSGRPPSGGSTSGPSRRARSSLIWPSQRCAALLAAGRGCASQAEAGRRTIEHGEATGVAGDARRRRGAGTAALLDHERSGLWRPAARLGRVRRRGRRGPRACSRRGRARRGARGAGGSPAARRSPRASTRSPAGTAIRGTWSPRAAAPRSRSSTGRATRWPCAQLERPRATSAGIAVRPREDAARARAARGGNAVGRGPRALEEAAGAFEAMGSRGWAEQARLSWPGSARAGHGRRRADPRGGARRGAGGGRALEQGDRPGSVRQRSHDRGAPFRRTASLVCTPAGSWRAARGARRAAGSRIDRLHGPGRARRESHSSRPPRSRW